MKKLVRILTLAVALMIGGQSFAQFNFHLGGLMNNVTSTTHPLGVTTTSVSSGYGFYGGFSYNLNLDHHFGFMVGVNGEYVNSRDTLDLTGMAGVTSSTTQVGVEVPVLFNFYIPFGRNVRLTLFGGTTLGFAILSKSDYKGVVAGVSTQWSEDLFENSDPGSFDYFAERYNWGLTYGARLSYKKVGLHACYYYGMTDLRSSDNEEGRRTRLALGLDVNF